MQRWFLFGWMLLLAGCTGTGPGEPAAAPEEGVEAPAGTYTVEPAVRTRGLGAEDVVFTETVKFTGADGGEVAVPAGTYRVARQGDALSLAGTESSFLVAAMEATVEGAADWDQAFWDRTDAPCLLWVSKAGSLAAYAITGGPRMRGPAMDKMAKAATMDVVLPDSNCTWSGGTVQTIKWKKKGKQEKEVTIWLYRQVGRDLVPVEAIATGVKNAGKYSWQVPGHLGGEFAVYIRTDDGQVNDFSQVFRLVGSGPSSVPVLSPPVVDGDVISLAWTYNSTVPLTPGDTMQVEESTTGATGSFSRIEETPIVEASGILRLPRSPGTYWYRVRARVADGLTGYSAVQTAQVVPPPPVDPPLLDDPTVSGTKVTLTWSMDWPGAASGEDAYLLEESNTGSDAGYKEAGNYASRTSPYSMTLDRTPGTYWYRVRARTKTGLTDYSNVESARIFPPLNPPQMVPAEVREETVKLMWTFEWPTPESPGDGYTLEESRTGATSGYALVDQYPQRASPFSVELTRSPGSYWFRVRARSAGAETSWSSPVLVQVIPPPPPAPPVLQALAPAVNAVALCWTFDWPATRGANDAYLLEESKTNATTGFNSAGPITARTSPCEVNLARTPGSYWYRVKARTWCGETQYSNVVGTAVVAPLAAPVLQPVAVSGTVVTLTWSFTWPTVTSSEDRYILEWSRTSATADFTLCNRYYDRTSPRSVSGGVSPGSYWFRVKAVTIVGESPYSNVQPVVINPTTSPSPPVISPIEVDGNTVRLTLTCGWTTPTSAGDAYALEQSTSGQGGPFVERSRHATRESPCVLTLTLDPGAYWFRARAVTSTALSGYSPVVNVFVCAAPAVGSPSVNANSINLNWDFAWPPTTTQADGYLLESMASNSNAFVREEIYLTRRTPFSATIVKAPGTWKFRVRAVHVLGHSPWSGVVTAVVAAPSTTVFACTAKWPIVYLTVDGQQYVTSANSTIAEGSNRKIELAVGAHNWEARTGYWTADGVRHEVYRYAGQFTQSATAVGQVTIRDPTIVDLMTHFGNTGRWTATFYEGRTRHQAVMVFTREGTCSILLDGNSLLTGNYGLNSYAPPTVQFSVSTGRSVLRGIMNELTLTFVLQGAPAGLENVEFQYTGS